jgi:transmembrane 9 superfamily protein 2/4
MLLSAFFGTGLQIFGMAVVVFFTTLAGTYSPINLTIIKSMAIMSFFVCGIVNGFAAGRLYAFFHGRDWVGLTFLTAITYPLIVTSGLLIIDICEFAETMRFTTLTLPEGFIVSSMFVLINIPSNLLGVFTGYKMTPIKTPTKVSRVPRDPPAQLPWFLGFSFSGIIAGGVPVFVIIFELYQIW